MGKGKAERGIPCGIWRYHPERPLRLPATLVADLQKHALIRQNPCNAWSSYMPKSRAGTPSNSEGRPGLEGGGEPVGHEAETREVVERDGPGLLLTEGGTPRHLATVVRVDTEHVLALREALGSCDLAALTEHHLSGPTIPHPMGVTVLQAHLTLHHPEVVRSLDAEHLVVRCRSSQGLVE